MVDEWRVEKRERNGDAYFVVKWSPLRKADRYEIVKKSPAVSGLIELYYKDDHGKYHLFHIAKAWYGGIRSSLRTLSDPELEKQEFRKGLLLKHEGEIYFRYSTTDSAADMDDIVYFFNEGYAKGLTGARHSGRYGKIFLREESYDKVYTIE
jgi:hypothetical protein